jgi:hypothetical protein
MYSASPMGRLAVNEFQSLTLAIPVTIPVTGRKGGSI